MLAPEHHGIPIHVALEWMDRRILRGRRVAREVRGPKHLNIGLKNIEYIESGDYFTLWNWGATGEKIHKHRNKIEVFTVDRVQMLRNMPQHWGLGLELAPAPPGGVYLGNRDASTKVVFLYSEDRDLVGQLSYIKEYMGAEKLIVIFSEYGGGYSYEIDLLQRKKIEVYYTTRLLDEDGKPQWELSEPERLKRGLGSTPWDIDLETKNIMFHEQMFELREISWDFMILLLTHYGSYVSHGVIIKELWPDKAKKQTPRDVNTAAHYLRKELGEFGPKWIKSKYGKGYGLIDPADDQDGEWAGA